MVIGPGLGGLACAAALARSGYAVSMVEQHYVAGGLTQTFHRSGFRWDVGVHYSARWGPRVKPTRSSIGSLAERESSLSSARCMTPFTFPEIFIAVRAPRLPCNSNSKKNSGIVKGHRRILAAVADADRAGRRSSRTSDAEAARQGHGMWHEAKSANGGAALVPRCWRNWSATRSCAQYWWHNGQTTGARRQVHGSVRMPQYASLFQRRRLSVGGAKGFADALIPVIERAGGKIRLNAKVLELLGAGPRNGRRRTARGQDADS